MMTINLERCGEYISAARQLLAGVKSESGKLMLARRAIDALENEILRPGRSEELKTETQEREDGAILALIPTPKEAEALEDLERVLALQSDINEESTFNRDKYIISYIRRPIKWARGKYTFKANSPGKIPDAIFMKLDKDPEAKTKYAPDATHMTTVQMPMTDAQINELYDNRRPNLRPPGRG